jgi:hypothetical protein
MATYMPRLDKACISDSLTPRTMMKEEISSPTYPPCLVYVFPQVLWTTWWWPICRAETGSCSYLMILLCFDWIYTYTYIYIYTHTILCIIAITRRGWRTLRLQFRRHNHILYSIPTLMNISWSLHAHYFKQRVNRKKIMAEIIAPLSLSWFYLLPTCLP